MGERSREINRRRRLPARCWSAAAGLVIALLLTPGAVLGQTPDETATPGPAASPTAGASFVSATAALGDIQWAREIDPATNAPIRRATGFVTTDPAIHAVIPVIRIEQGVVVSATWSFDGEPVPALDATVTAASAYENGWITFSLVRPDESIWPTGRYAITIAVDGVEALTAEVDVQVPPA